MATMSPSLSASLQMHLIPRQPWIDNLNDFAVKIPPSSPKRPSHRRGRSTRDERLDVFRDIRHVFQRALTKSWGSSAEFKALARDFYAVSIGLSPGHSISDPQLNQFQAALLAIELSRVVNTSDVLFIHDSANSALIACHTLALTQKLDNFHSSETIFVGVDSGKPVTIPSAKLPWIAQAIVALRGVLQNTCDQIVETSVLGWSEDVTKRRMLTLGDWLIDAPVCYVIEHAPLPSRPLYQMVSSEKFWTLSMHMDAHDPENDHTFNQWRLPASIFASESSSAERSNLSADGVHVKHSFTAVQDRMQSTLFNALNSVDAAASIWSEVSIITEA